MEAFDKLADYYKDIAPAEGGTLDEASALLIGDMNEGFALADAAARTGSDRGAQRSLVWSQKVSAMLKSLLDRFAEEGEVMLAGTNIYVCDICGFIMLGDAPPKICPVCKVPDYKIIRMERN
jgi:rubrerythrin